MAQSDDVQTHRDADSASKNLLSEVGDMLLLGLKGFASLKITVGAFAFAIFLILAGTLAQVDLDIHIVLKDYFRSWIVRIPLQVFLPVTFFPSQPKIGGWFWFPGGALIGTVMFINLTAAHAVRFKIQTRGTRLWTGIGVIALGSLITYMVIHSGSNPDGLQAEPILEWNTLWQILKYGLGAAWVAMASTLLKIDSKRKMERAAIIAMTLLIGAGVIYLFYMGDDAKLKDESMRILWQLIKAEVAALTLLVGCIMVFKKRGGIVLLHAGVGLMMFSELLVAKTAIEGMMPIYEGETANYLIHGRSIELAVVDTSAKEYDQTVVVPASRLTSAAKQDEVFRDEQIPFDIKVLDYFVNSEMRLANFKDPKSPVTRGGGLSGWVNEISPSTGTDTEQKFDAPSAYLEFIDKKTSKSLGVYLMSLHLLEQTVRVGDKTYEVALRFKRTYKTYSMHLINVRSDLYLGTKVNRNYSSELQLVDTKDPAGTPPRKVLIKMNDPLRYAGETFYQSGYNGPSAIQVSEVDPRTGEKNGIHTRKLVNDRPVIRESTTLQVVTNVAWMIPYVACMIVATGMLSHFWLILVRFLNRFSNIKRGNDAIGLAELRIPAAIIGVFALWVGSQMIVRSPKADEMDLYEFGKLPVVSGARAKPFDSLARNSLRSLSSKQTFDHGEDTKQPATRWLLDVITDHEKAERYQVFRVESLEVLAMLGLSRRPGYRYSFHEIKSSQKDALKLIAQQEAAAYRVKSKYRTPFQRKVIVLANAVNTYQALQYAFVLPSENMKNSDDSLRKTLLRGHRSGEFIPLATPHHKNKNDPWKTLSDSSVRLWVRRFAKENNIQTVDELVFRLAFNRDATGPDPEVEKGILRILQMLKQNENPKIPSDVNDEEVIKKWDSYRPFQKMTLAKNFFTNKLDAIMQGESLSAADPPEVAALVDILSAYRDGNTEAFNTGLANYKAVLDELQPTDYDPAKLRFESWMNRFEPFYHSAILYLLAFILSAGSWMGWQKPLRRSAFGLVLMAFGIHTFALIARMYISGRWGVTVTNLYSSAIFIGWAGCLLGILLEMVHRISIGTAVAGAAGFGCLLIAHFLSLDGDTIKVMQAVLDTDFWLATHVTTITLGYATTYIAGLIGMGYIIAGLFTPALQGETGKTLNRMIYGTLCFSIFFSFVGTVLGGLWADDSWGRFWGWDPKENGALIIVLWNALVLHARWGNMVKDRGLAVLVVGGNIVTTWSWFGVNMLGVGLHSYGFQDGVGLALLLVCAVNMAVIGLGCAPKELWRSFRDRSTTA